MAVWAESPKTFVLIFSSSSFTHTHARTHTLVVCRGVLDELCQAVRLWAVFSHIWRVGHHSAGAGEQTTMKEKKKNRRERERERERESKERGSRFITTHFDKHKFSFVGRKSQWATCATLQPCSVSFGYVRCLEEMSMFMVTPSAHSSSFFFSFFRSLPAVANQPQLAFTGSNYILVTRSNSTLPGLSWHLLLSFFFFFLITHILYSLDCCRGLRQLWFGQPCQRLGCSSPLLTALSVYFPGEMLLANMRVIIEVS